MDFPDSTPTLSAVSDSTVSDVLETLSLVSIHQSDKESKTITDLPSEMILRIYGLLDSASEIIALNITSQTCYWIWRTNAPSISKAVLSRSIAGYSSALELFEVEERVKQIHCIMIPHFTILKRVRVAQREAREAVQKRRPDIRWDHTSKDAFYLGILQRNERLLSAAKDACHLLKLIENKVVCSGGTSSNSVDSEVTPSSHDIIIAYHELIILIRLRSLKAMRDRLSNMCKRKIRKMLYVATYIVCDCPDKDKIRLGISRHATLRIISWSWVLENWDLISGPRCQMLVCARRACFAVADAVGEARIPDHLVENKSGCHGDCTEVGKS